MNIYGMIFFIASWAFILALTAFCLYRVLGKKEKP